MVVMVLKPQWDCKQLLIIIISSCKHVQYVTISLAVVMVVVGLNHDSFHNLSSIFYSIYVHVGYVWGLFVQI